LSYTSQAINRYSSLTGSRYTIGTNTVGVFTNGAPDRACNNLSWADGCAYAAWAGLRPMTELEFEKACRGPATAVADEYAWGASTYTAIEGLQGTDGSGQEYYTAGNVNHSQSTGPAGPVRAGIFAKASSSRAQAGASFWGIMELSGNMYERCVSMDFPNGRLFTGTSGSGGLDESGNATNTDWYASTGAVANRGGDWGDNAVYARVADRAYTANNYTARGLYFSVRAVRAAPSGVGP